MELLDAQGLVQVFRRRGHVAYEGEGVTQWQHAWQCAQLARRADASPALQLAAWLHDLGHLLSDRQGTPTLEGHDDRHEARAAEALLPLFGAAVAQPVALHVLAKRYLVSRQPAYRERLTPDSVRSLALQGGPMGEAESAAFDQLPHAADAVKLRVWDDLAKDASWEPTPDAEAELLALIGEVAAARP